MLCVHSLHCSLGKFQMQELRLLAVAKMTGLQPRRLRRMLGSRRETCRKSAVDACPRAITRDACLCACSLLACMCAYNLRESSSSLLHPPPPGEVSLPSSFSFSSSSSSSSLSFSSSPLSARQTIMPRRGPFAKRACKEWRSPKTTTVTTRRTCFFHVPKHDSVLSLVIFQPPSDASNLGKRVIS